MRLTAAPLTAEAFAPFGDVPTLGQGEMRLINAGLCERHHDLANLQVQDGRLGLSLFRAQIRPLPLRVDLLERHPLGSQCFVPLGGSDYIVTVAPDDHGQPGAPLAFHARGDQPVNLAPGTWHGVLAPISGSGLFAVVDRIGDGTNLEEVILDTAVIVSLPD